MRMRDVAKKLHYVVTKDSREVRSRRSEATPVESPEGCFLTEQFNWAGKTEK